jgi:hypothetical protein
LDVLGKIKNFSRLSIDELKGYCGLVQSENNCESAADAAEALAFRYGWPTSSRLGDIETAWKSLTFAVDDAEDEDQEGGDASSRSNAISAPGGATDSESTAPRINASSIPIVIKNNSWDRKVLLCEIDDPEFDVSGDSGAVGRISASSSSLLFDLKGMWA